MSAKGGRSCHDNFSQRSPSGCRQLLLACLNAGQCAMELSHTWQAAQPCGRAAQPSPWCGPLQVTGPALTLAGFPAWLVRTSEIYGVGALSQLSDSQLDAALRRFCTTKQRFGK